MKLTFNRNVPREVREAARPLLKKNARLVPTWCHHLEVEWDDEADSYASVRIQMEYRRAWIVIGPQWLDKDEAGRERTLVHEIAHLLAEPLQKYCIALMTKVLDQDNPLTEWAAEQFRCSMESMICDLQHALTHGR